MPSSCLLFVQTLERPVVAFVEAPISMNRDVGRTHCGKCQSVGLDRAGEEARVGLVEREPRCSHRGPCGRRLCDTARGEGNVVPAREQVQFVPGALSVAEQNQDAGHVVRLEDPQNTGKLEDYDQLEWISLKFSVTGVGNLTLLALSWLFHPFAYEGATPWLRQSESTSEPQIGRAHV